MSGTFRLMVLCAIFLSSSQAMAFDFAKEISKQNNVYVKVVPYVGQKAERQHLKPTSKRDSLKIRLVSKKS